MITKGSEAAPFPTKYNAHTPTGVMLDHTSIRQWIEQYVPGGHGAPLGRLLDIAYDVEFGRPTSEQSALNLVYLLTDQPDAKDLSLFGFTILNATPEEQRRCAEDINRWLAEQKLHAQVGRTFPLAEAAAAHRLQEENTLHKAGTLTGKIVLTL